MCESLSGTAVGADPCDEACQSCETPCVREGCKFCPVNATETVTFRDVEVPVTDPEPQAFFEGVAAKAAYDEIRRVSETGGEKGEKPAKLGGADPLALEQLALVYGFGEEKYSRFNYLKGYPWSLSIDALYRHFLAFQAGEDNDPESGLPHMAHVAWHALALTSFGLRQLGTDDRPPRR